jgi:Lipase (class 3)
MTFHAHFNDAQRLADTLDNWADDQFSWDKAYIAAVFAALAYEELPQFELKKSKRAKLIPCDSYQAHVSRWETTQRRASVQELDTNTKIEVIVRRQLVITVSSLTKVVFISLRGTTLSFSDFKADLDIRKVRYQSGFGESVRLHRGFFDAVLECFDEVVERLKGTNVPIYVTGHSLGGAMAAILHARLDEADFHPFRHRPRHRLSSAVSCYTFGMPRYGDTSAKAALPQPYHIYNELDAIPTLPPKLLGFADSANERCLNAIPEIALIQSKGDFALRKGKGIATILGVSDHRMERYMERTKGMRR